MNMKYPASVASYKAGPRFTLLTASPAGSIS